MSRALFSSGLASAPVSGHPAALSMVGLRRYCTISIAAAALALAACKGKCRQLSERLCDCAVNNIARDNCLTRAANEDGRVGPTSSDEARCAELLQVCDCHRLNTSEGKVSCGLARNPNSVDGGF